MCRLLRDGVATVFGPTVAETSRHVQTACDVSETSKHVQAVFDITETSRHVQTVCDIIENSRHVQTVCDAVEVPHFHTHWELDDDDDDGPQAPTSPSGLYSFTGK